MPLTSVDFRPTIIRRAEIGLSSPIPEEKQEIWRNISVPQTSISKDTGGYAPLRITAQAHYHPASTILVAGGVRGSKSVSLSMEALTWLPHSDLIWLAGESYDDCRQEFEYLAEASVSLGWTSTRLISFPQNKYQPCSFETTWGTLIETKSLADPGSLMSRAPDFLGFCEPGKTNYASYKRGVERMTTRRGPFWMNGTFEETAPWMEEFWKQWARWPNEWNAKSFSSPSYTNKVIYPLGAKDPGINQMLLAAESFDEFLRRVVGVPASVPDLIFSDTWKPRQHIAPIEFSRRDSLNALRPVYAAIDPGYSGDSRYVFLAIQIVGNEIRVIDEIVGRGLTHQEVKRQCMVKDWWPVLHSGTIDPHAGGSHVFGSISPQEEWAADSNGGKVALALPKYLNVEELIRLIKSYLTGIRGFVLRIHPRCERLIYEMRAWKRKKNAVGLGLPNTAPCDAIKALGYFLTHHARGMVDNDQSGVLVRPYDLMGGRDPVRMMEEEAMRLRVENWIGDEADAYTR